MPEPDREPEIYLPGQPPRREREEFVAQPAKLLRIATMIRELLAEVRQAPIDEGGRNRLREVYGRAVAEMKEALSPDLQEELGTLTVPLEGKSSESEIRLAQAQLVGWLEGLFQGIQAAMAMQQVQARAQMEEMRRRGLPPHGGDGPEGPEGAPRPGPGQYL